MKQSMKISVLAVVLVVTTTNALTMKHKRKSAAARMSDKTVAGKQYVNEHMHMQFAEKQEAEQTPASESMEAATKRIQTFRGLMSRLRQDMYGESATAHATEAAASEEGPAVTADLERILKLRPSADYKRPVLTVELRGGLGNQLFQVAALLSAGLKNSPSFSVALPNELTTADTKRQTYWHSVLHKLQPLLLGLQAPAPTGGRNAIKPVVGKCLVQQVPGFDSFLAADADCSFGSFYNATWESDLRSRVSSCETVKLNGYFQHPAFFSPILPLLRHVFWDEDAARKAKANLAALMPGAGHERPVVAVHYRLGDYASLGWVLDSDYYDAALLQVTRLLAPRRPRCLIFSDEPQRAWARSAVLQGCAEKVLATAEDTATSFHMMSLAQASVIADSSFSYWAAVLGNKKQAVVAPKLPSSDKKCWPYMQDAPGPPADTAWIQVPARTLSSQESKALGGTP